MKSAKTPVLIISTLLSSCATIIHGPTTKITLDYDEKTSVVVDGKPIKPGAHKIQLKSKDKHTVVMTKDGFKSVTHELKPQRTMTSIWNLGGMAISVPFWANVNSQGDGATTALGVMVVAPIAMSAVDGLSGSNFVLEPRNVGFKAIKLPPQITAQNLLPIGCSEVTIRIKIGEKIGATRYNGREITQLNWENTVNVKAVELEVIVNNGLKDLGFKVPKELSENVYDIHAEISSINLNRDLVGGLLAGEALTECKLTTKWTLIQPGSELVLKTFTTESFNIDKFNSPANAFLSAFENSFLTFMESNPEVYTAVIKNNNAAPVNNFDEINISKVKLPAKTSLQESIQSVVTIESEGNGYGSGFVISEDGYVLTNSHVVKNNKQVNIILQNGISFVGDVIRQDSGHDLALIKLNGKGFKPLILSENYDNNKIAAEVYAVGTPADKSLSQTISKGIISGNRLINGITYLQTDVSVSPGSSGGPLVNKDGVVIGVVTSKIVNKGVEGISFALPTAKAFEVLKLNYK